ncbi:carbon monoxide dehydrogenase subunit G [Microtetraspora sp. NBRC 13810]|uniref:CoxG family protein n=1 Tax=Microtetraspora sp. NBRC 13810 TaxID=3030990 RepID=UPI0024A4197D|nr:carbon monoxide dehydrogenase subunit G [Microtetraspora sp. NBRC 13810]GLW11886.1 carbon monoxide dehydrogenase subunit G [Microtetraspora sp. NBRC 13810]
MKVVGSALLEVERGRLWQALRDPAVLVRTIPGCERLEALGGDAYRMTVSAGVASIKGVYEGEVALSDFDEPASFVLKASGQGAPGTVDATVTVRLAETDGGTQVDYDAEAVVGGMIGGVGQRMLGTVAKKTAAEFFTAVETHLTTPALPEPHLVAPGTESQLVAPGTEPHLVVPGAESRLGTAATSAGTEAHPAAVAVPAATKAHPATEAHPAMRPGTTYERPAGAVKAGVPPWTMLAAFGAGAGVALGSAVIGWVLGRTARRR